MRSISLLELQVSLAEVIMKVSRSNERVQVTVDGFPAALLWPIKVAEGYSETVELLSDRSLLQRIDEGERAIQNGDFVTQWETATPDHPSAGAGYPSGRRSQVSQGSQGASREEKGSLRWHLLIGGPAMKALNALRPEVRAIIDSYLVHEIVENPESAGVELSGALDRRWSARVGDYRIIYRLDTIQRAVRIIDVHPVV
ncbi:MAG: hypothetical protein M1519_06350 [Actinobacteria bacterium]|jgi:mRNA-degrading endonuclease RelE of RelBE toxin-antitoxin system/antitoxin (DNA-binding transcriptional repressor) of toxin-antitoxin stability system|nr:hypothetical protein [Actinomycetota bacterium]